MSSSHGSDHGWQWFKDPRLVCLGFRGIFPSIITRKLVIPLLLIKFVYIYHAILTVFVIKLYVFNLKEFPSPLPVSAPLIEDDKELMNIISFCGE